MDDPPRRNRIRPMAWATWALLLNCMVFGILVDIEMYPGDWRFQITPPRTTPLTNTDTFNWVVGIVLGLVILVGPWALFAWRSRSNWVDGICFIVTLLTLATTVDWWQLKCPPFKGSLWSDTPWWLQRIAPGLAIVDIAAWLAIAVFVVFRLLRFLGAYRTEDATEKRIANDTDRA
jgi:hypothetical protein